MKNFFVSTESVKGRDGGLAGYQNYLTMKEHPNHEKATTAIYGLFDGGKSPSPAFENILIDTFDYEANEGERRMKEGVRGRYKLDSFAQSFVLAIPKFNDMNEHIRPTKEQWDLIFRDVINNTLKGILIADRNRVKKEKYIDESGVEQVREIKLPSKYDDINASDFSRVIFANIHEQKEGNDHLNIVVGKLVKGKIIKELTQKRAVETMKMEFNRSLAKHCGLKVENYKPVQTDLPKKRQKVAARHTIMERLKVKQLAAEFGEELLKPIQNYVTNVERGRVENAAKWHDAFENKRAEIFDKNVTEFGLDDAFVFDERLKTAMEKVSAEAELKSIPKVENKPRSFKP